MAEPWPSVTRILRDVGLGPDLSGIDPEVLDRARERGLAVHAAIEAEHYGFTYNLAPEWRPWLVAYHDYVSATGHEPIASELQVRDPAWRVVGHVDRLAWRGGRRGVVDWKCGMADGVEIQLAAYWTLYNAQHPEAPVEWAEAVQLKGDGTYRVHPVDPKKPLPCGFTAEQVWYAAVTLWWARQEAGR